MRSRRGTFFLVQLSLASIMTFVLFLFMHAMLQVLALLVVLFFLGLFVSTQKIKVYVVRDDNSHALVRQAALVASVARLLAPT